MRTCFFITPIGEVGTFDRKRSDTLLSYLLETVCKKYHIKVIRADNINEATSLINAIFENLFFADIVISDLSNNNPNVFYETAVRHCTGKPIIHIAQIGQSLPFDIKDFYTIFVDHTDGNNLKQAEERLEEIIKRSIQDTEIFNPVTISAKLNNINISFSLLPSKDILLNEVKDVLLKVTDTLENIKPLIEDSAHKKTPILTGKWISNLGIIDLVNNGNCISGRYQYHSKDYVGLIEGKFIDNFIVFKWKWTDRPLNGVGFWYIGEGDFTGGWFSASEDYSYEKLIKSLKKEKNIEMNEYHRWIIYGKVKEI